MVSTVVVQVLLKMLEKIGYKADVALNGAIAVDMAREKVIGCFSLPSPPFFSFFTFSSTVSEH